MERALLEFATAQAATLELAALLVSAVTASAAGGTALLYQLSDMLDAPGVRPASLHQLDGLLRCGTVGNHLNQAKWCACMCRCICMVLRSRCLASNEVVIVQPVVYALGWRLEYTANRAKVYTYKR
jgi:hypothetical protein